MIKKECKERTIKVDISHFFCDKCNKNMGWEITPKYGGYINYPLKKLDIRVYIGTRTLGCADEIYIKKSKELCEDCYKIEKENAIKELEKLGYVKE